MRRKIEIDLYEIIDIWHAMASVGVHEEDLLQFIPKNLTDEEVEDYCKTMLPLNQGYTEEDDWREFKEKLRSWGRYA